tara:strand:+ start:5504 stop:6361 length:858 start_codon:yes stop_codon:yes gene_type:complete
VLQKHRKQFSHFGGQAIACVLPESLTHTCILELPMGSEAEIHDLVAQDLADQQVLTTEELTFDFWVEENPTTEGMANVHAVCINTKVVKEIVSQFLAIGYHCDRIDSHANSLAQLIPDTSTSLSVVIDWGLDEVTLIICDAGQPFYSRKLRNCQTRPFFKELAEHWSISPADCDALLNRLCHQEHKRSTELKGLKDSYLNLSRELFLRLADEASRTIDFAHQKKLFTVPEQVLLVGSGAGLPFVSREINRLLPLPVQTESLTEKYSTAGMSEFIVAMTALEGSRS